MEKSGVHQRTGEIQETSFERRRKDTLQGPSDTRNTLKRIAAVEVMRLS